MEMYGYALEAGLVYKKKKELDGWVEGIGWCEYVWVWGGSRLDANNIVAFGGAPRFVTLTLCVWCVCMCVCVCV